jgi:hypothetical protein
MAGAIFIGRIPYTYTYMNDYSGDEPFWNLSVWYREFNGAEMFRHFSDSDAVLAREDTTFNRGYEGNALRHIWISRLYSVNAAYGDEITLMRRALDANHDYRTGASRYPHKAFLWNQNNDRLYSDTTLREVWPEAERLPFYGRIVRAPGDTLFRIFSTYQPGSAGELWDVTTHMNIDKLNPAPMWLTLWDDSLLDRPFQQRFSLLGGCERASPGSIANQHLLTRGGGGVLSGTCTNHIPYFGYWSLADKTAPKNRMRAFLSAGAPWGRSWIRSNMSIYVNYWYGDFTLKVMMDSANKVPVVDTLRKSFPAAGRVRLSAAAHDDDGTITAYEWWFSKSYNYGMNEPDTVTAVPAIEIDIARCTTHVRLEVIDNYKARFFITLNRDSLVIVPPPVKRERAPRAPTPLFSVFPNPFNPAATIAFRATRPGVAVLRVFNTAGRQVGFQTLAIPGAGGFTMRWEALDNRGNRLPSGLYGFALEADNRRFYKTMALVK